VCSSDLQKERAETVRAALQPGAKEIEKGQAFYLLPRSLKGRLMLGILFFSLLSFLVSILLGGLGLGKIAALLSIASMVVYFTSGFLRLSFD
jgi:hypothetical protein